MTTKKTQGKITSVGKDVEKVKLSCTVGANANGAAAIETVYGSFLEN